jgi:hypothetical protein
MTRTAGDQRLKNAGAGRAGMRRCKKRPCDARRLLSVTGIVGIRRHKHKLRGEHPGGGQFSTFEYAAVKSVNCSVGTKGTTEYHNIFTRGLAFYLRTTQPPEQGRARACI